MACATTYKRLLDEVVQGTLSPKGWEQLRGHLAVCQGCRKLYNRAVSVERLLAGGPKALALPAPSELLRLGDAVIAAVQPAARPSSVWGWLRWVVPAAVTAALAVVLVPPLLRHKDQGPGSPVAARPSAGPASPENHGGALLAQVQAYCQPTGAVNDSTAGGNPRLVPLGPDDSCGADSDLLRLSVTSAQGRYPYAFVFGLDGDLDIKWYEPGSAAASSVKLPAQAQGQVLTSIRLKPAHRAGPLRVLGLFSERPLTGTEVEAAVARARAEKKDVTGLAKLDGLPAGVYQSSFVIQLR
jgi:hypothetical protein